MLEVEYPWQRLPTNLIAHAFEHMEQNNEFDHQIAYLLLDVSVETVINIYRSLPENYDKLREFNKKIKKERKNQPRPDNSQDVKKESTPNPDDESLSIEKPNFHIQLRSIQELAGHKLEDIDIRRIEYFHSVRNKLYHEGDGVTTWELNLQEYGGLAVRLLKVLLDVDLPKLREEKEWQELTQGGTFDRFEALSFGFMPADIKEALKGLRLDISVVAEFLRPQYTSRKLFREFKRIWLEHPDSDGVEHWERTMRQDKRKDQYDRLVGDNTADNDFIDGVLRDPVRLYASVVFEQLYENSDQQYEMFEHVCSFVEKAPKGRVDVVEIEGSTIRHSSTSDPNEIYQEYKAMLSWIKDVQGKMAAFINDRSKTNLLN